MELYSLLFIAIGLSMDAFAVSITSGITIQRIQLKHVLRIALFFGVFQGVMPLLGWVAGNRFQDSLSSVDHWVAFGLLTFIGSKMIYESRKLEVDSCRDPCNTTVLFTLAIATSIDAFGVGLSLSILSVSILFPALVIGIVTFCISVIGIYIGDTVGHLFEKKIEIIGGLILILIGVKILHEHIGLF